MTFAYRYLFPCMWLSWAGYWWLLSGNVKASARRDSLPSRLLYALPLLLGILLLWVPNVPVPVLGKRFLPWTAWTFWTGAALAAAGLLFAVWARRHLGRNWSGSVTIKEGHELITHGPYAMVRHPIYAGLLTALAGSAVARGEWRGVLAVLIAALAFWRKVQIEERWMREHFGEPYQSYSRRVAALVPFIL